MPRTIAPALAAALAMFAAPSLAGTTCNFNVECYLTDYPMVTVPDVTPVRVGCDHKERPVLPNNPYDIFP